MRQLQAWSRAALSYRVGTLPLWRRQANVTLLSGFGKCLRFAQTSDAWEGGWYQYLGLHGYGPVPCYGKSVRVPKKVIWGLRFGYGGKNGWNVTMALKRRDVRLLG